jgi:hypothetical protein
MKNATPRMRLACILVLMLPVLAFGQQAAKGLFNPEANVENAVTYDSRGNSQGEEGRSGGSNGRLQSGHPAQSEICRHPGDICDTM